jgi:hypothetical protein
VPLSIDNVATAVKDDVVPTVVGGKVRLAGPKVNVVVGAGAVLLQPPHTINMSKTMPWAIGCTPRIELPVRILRVRALLEA